MKDKNQVVWRRKHIGNEVADICDMPRQFAYQVVSIILEVIKIKIHKDKKIIIPKWGIFTVQKRFGYPRFRPAAELLRYVRERPDYQLEEHCRTVCRKIIRFSAKRYKDDDYAQRQIKHQKYHLWAYLRKHPGVTEWLKSHDYLPEDVEVKLKRYHKRVKELSGARSDEPDMSK